MAKILLTGSTGYIGRRLLPDLVKQGHKVVCLVREPRRFDYEDFSVKFLENVEVVKADLTKSESLQNLPADIDVAYYLVHSMSGKYGKFSEMEAETAQNFADFVKTTHAKQIVYLGGIVNDDELSEHLESRLRVEKILRDSDVPVTALRAAIIIGSGSASFEILRDLVEKLPVMVAPKWTSTRCQPISIRNVIEYLSGVAMKEEAFGRVFDIGGPDILTYKQMILQFAHMRELTRRIVSVPLMTPRLSSYWLYFVTSVSYNLARNLVNSLHNEVVVENRGIEKIVPTKLLDYRQALEMAFQKIAQNIVTSSWKDTVNGPVNHEFMDFIQVPKHGCFTDVRSIKFDRDAEEVRQNIWSIGGERGWYYGDWLWHIRGFLDKMVGGVGLRRGRRNADSVKPGDALDFWRVILADKEKKRLLLYAEMKLPGEAWLEFCVDESKEQNVLVQRATFRPKGLFGRLYWYVILPLHGLIFPNMAQNIINYQRGGQP